MDLPSSVDDQDVVINPKVENASFRLRAYQAEMLEESLKRNIIVVQDTGSGKTHIALARAAAELEICKPHKSQLVWFLAPTVALCEQQYKVFKSSLPAHETQLLTGNDGVDYWSDQNTWDAVLANVRIVLSTHAVLRDALTHGFVTMSRLALLIFDEAHHCTGRHPANELLNLFYHPRLHGNLDIPRILGLSASPVIRAKAGGEALEQIERNLNAITKTPKIHRSELLRFVHKPQLLRVNYSPVFDIRSPLLVSLESALMNYDMSNDPYVVDLVNNPMKYRNSEKRIQDAYFKHDTYCYRELKTLVSKYKDTAAELGSSVADWCLYQCIAQFQTQVRSSDQLLDWSHSEKLHLQKIFKRLPLPEDYASQSMLLDRLSPKVEALVELLTSEPSRNLTGLIFVEQRVWVAALAELFSLHPEIRGKLSVGTFVGNSANAKRKSTIATMVEPKNQQDTLDKLRAGLTNLIIATSVLEEGIDVSACHLVVCFESPKNLKSFIQRRGRARRMQSKYVIFSPGEGNDRSPATWEQLEKEMRDAYENDLRHAKEAEEKELENEGGERYYQVTSTQALLTLDNAVPHLNHFCALLASDPYVDTRPQFDFHQENGNIAAEVTLPLAVDPTLRVTRSLRVWRTEGMAVKDAAFEAYKMLHEHGLVSDNLLPVKDEEDALAAEFQKSDKVASLIEVSPAFDPWFFIAQHQQQHPFTYHRTLLEIQGIQEQAFYLEFYIPMQLPALPTLTFFWNESKHVLIHSHRLPETTFSSEELITMRAITRNILSSVHGSRIDQMRNDLPWLLVPSNGSQSEGTLAELLQWDAETNGVEKASELITRDKIGLEKWGQVNVSGDNRKWFPRSFDFQSKDPASAPEPTLHLTLAPKRRDFVYPVRHSQRMNEAYTRVERFAASDCSVDMLPVAYSVCAMLLPSVLYRYETYLMTDSLRLGLLAPVSFRTEDLPRLVQAMTMSSTDTTHYQRLEFLGDCIVKVIASVHLMASHLKWPESFLTGKKGKIVSNGFFARATLSAGLDKFIIRKRFTGAKWRPRYTNDILSVALTEENHPMSSKTLADVIESLVGASYTIGGFPKAFTCMQTLLPQEPWVSIPESNNILHEAIPVGLNITGLTIVEELIGYTFNKKMALLEALTHASYKGPLANCSYERLEFLGDAVLDYVVSKRLYNHAPELGHAKMHGIRTAMANAAFLAFRMFETTVAQERIIPPDMHHEVHYRCLWQFLRSDAAALIVNRDAAIAQYDSAKDMVRHALQNEDVFPWHILALMDSPKFLSDIVESIIGAIYVDSHGDITACETFVRKLGILECLERILRDGVDCLHPKERLGILAVEKDVRYVRVAVDDTIFTAGVKHGYRCQVRVGDVDVGAVVEGVKRLNAETIAAWEACKLLKDREGKGKEGDITMNDIEDEDQSSDEEWFDAEDGGIRLSFD